MIKTYSYPIKLLFLSLAIVSAYLLFYAPRVLAFNPNDIPNNQKTSVNDYVNGTGGSSQPCSTNPNKYAYYQWLNKQGDLSQNATITIPYGTTDIPLELNRMVFVCKSPNLINEDGRTYNGLPNDGTPTANVKLNRTDTYINNVTTNGPGNILGSPAGSTSSINRNNGARYWFGNTLGFTYRSNAPITTNQTLNFIVTNTYINRFSSGNQCVGSGTYNNNPPTHGCSSTNASFTLQIIVGQPPNTTIRGRVFNLPSGTGYGGVVVETCNGTVATDSNGFFAKEVPVGTGFCARVVSANPAPGLTGPFVRPYNITGYPPPPAYPNNSALGYPNQSPNCPAFTGVTSGYCGRPTYECQVAGQQAAGCGLFEDRSADEGYDIVYEYPPTVNSCGSITLSPPNPETGEPFEARVSFSTTGGDPSRSYAYTVQLRIDGGVHPLATIGSGSIAANSTAIVAKPGIVGNNPGTYNGQWVVSGAINLTCNFGVGFPQGPVTITNIPYVRFYGSDVETGAGFTIAPASSCSPSAGTIDAYNRSSDGSADYRGSASQLGTFSLGRITEFVSASSRPTAPTPPKGLTFANVGPGDGSNTYGGGFGNSGCVSDYFKGIDASSPNYFIGGTRKIPSGGSGPLPSGSLPLSGQKTLYFGDGLRVEGNIEYTNGPWANVDAVPSLYVIVKGDIYIDDDVTRMDGVYIAIPDNDTPTSPGGNIYTCSKNNGPYNLQQINRFCRKQLVVNGAFIAKKVHFLRMFGTRLKGAGDEHPLNAPNKDCGAPPPAIYRTCAAEVFNGSPDLWLSAPPPSRDRPPYEAIGNLPPIF